MKKINRFFEESGERYKFDFELCTSRKGWAQVDTSSDAWYFGLWANPEQLKTCCYCEGDVTVVELDTPAEFVDEINYEKDFHDRNENGFRGIDPGSNENLKAWFVAMGLENLLH